MARDSLFVQDDELDESLPFEEASDSDLDPPQIMAKPVHDLPARKDFLWTRKLDYKEPSSKAESLKKKSAAITPTSGADIQQADDLMSTAMVRRKRLVTKPKASSIKQDLLSKRIATSTSETTPEARERKRRRTASPELAQLVRPQHQARKKPHIDTSMPTSIPPDAQDPSRLAPTQDTLIAGAAESATNGRGVVCDRLRDGVEDEDRLLALFEDSKDEEDGPVVR